MQRSVIVPRLYINVLPYIVVFLVRILESDVDDLRRVPLPALRETKIGTNLLQMNEVQRIIEGIDELFQIVLATLVLQLVAFSWIAIGYSDVLRVNRRDVTAISFHSITSIKL